MCYVLDMGGAERKSSVIVFVSHRDKIYDSMQTRL
jgi:hypothetical protein